MYEVKQRALGVPATMSDGSTSLRLVLTDLRQSEGQPAFDGEISFPLVTGNEGVFRELYLHMANDLDLSKWEITYSDSKRVRYRVRSVKWAEIKIEQSSAIFINAHVSCEKIVADPTPLPVKAELTQDAFMSPVRIYTWNDAVCSVSERGKEIIPGSSMRSTTMRFERSAVPGVSGSVVIATGSIVILGENVHTFDPQNVAVVEMGYQLKTSGIFQSLNTIRISGVQFKEWPGYVEEQGGVYEREEVNGVEVMREVSSQNLLCTRLDWERA